MLLLFRFLWITIASIFRSRIDPLGESVVHFTVLPHDCDLNIHLNAGRYLSFMDVARMDLIGRTGLGRKLLKKKWRPIMGGCQVLYRREIRPFEPIAEKGADTFCAKATVRTLIRGKSGNVTPKEVLALVGAEDLESPQFEAF